MEQRLCTNDATLKDAPNMLRREECALSMGQHGQRSDVAVKVVQT